MVDDHLFLRPIKTFGQLLEELNNGRFHMRLGTVTVSNYGAQPLEIENVEIELNYENGQWATHTIYADAETFDESTDTGSSGLQERLERVVNSLKLLLTFARSISSIARLA